MTNDLNINRSLRAQFGNPYVLLTAFCLAIAFIAILFTSFHYGIGIDGSVQHIYGRHVVNWYASLFEDKGALNFKNLYLYGGFFECYLALPEYLFGLGEWQAYKLRKLLTALFGFAGVFGVIKIVWLLTNDRRAVFFASLLMLVNPVYYGQSFINSKDIPFAVTYVWSVYYLLKLVLSIPDWRWATVLKLALAVGVSLAIRSGALVLYGYFVLFICLGYVFHLKDDYRQWKKHLWECLLYSSVFGAISYLLMVAFWPWAQMNPILNPIKSVSSFSSFIWNGMVHYQGEYVRASELPVSFVFHMLLIQNTELLLFGFLAGILILVQRCRDLFIKSLPELMLLFAVIFPLLYLVIKRPIIYDNFRHFLFVIPVACAVSGIGISRLIEKCSGKWKRMEVIILLVTLMLTFQVVFVMVRLHPYQYAYYNLFSGGPEVAYKKFESEYMMTSYEEVLGELEAELNASESEGAFKVYSTHGESSVYLRNSKRLESVSKNTDADFHLLTTRWEEHKSVPLPAMYESGRYGQVFSCIKDVRIINFFDELKYDVNQSEIFILNQRNTELLKLKVPVGMLERAVVVNQFFQPAEFTFTSHDDFQLYYLCDSKTAPDDTWVRRPLSYSEDLVMWSKNVRKKTVVNLQYRGIYLLMNQ